MDSKAINSLAVQRGVRSFYADLVADPQAVRVCTGLSCHLAGARCPDEARFQPPGACGSVSGLLRPFASPLERRRPDRSDSQAAGRYRSGNIAREAIVTARIGKGDYSDLGARVKRVFSGRWKKR